MALCESTEIENRLICIKTAHYPWQRSNRNFRVRSKAKSTRLRESDDKGSPLIVPSSEIGWLRHFAAQEPGRETKVQTKFLAPSFWDFSQLAIHCKRK